MHKLKSIVLAGHETKTSMTYPPIIAFLIKLKKKILFRHLRQFKRKAF